MLGPPEFLIPFELPPVARIYRRQRTHIHTCQLSRDDPDVPANVVANCQVDPVSSVLTETLIARIRHKDRAGTEFLLITTGLPDRSGYLCPADAFVFELIGQSVASGRIEIPPLRYLKQVVLNHWRNPQSTMVLADQGGLLQRESVE